MRAECRLEFLSPFHVGLIGWFQQRVAYRSLRCVVNADTPKVLERAAVLSLEAIQEYADGVFRYAGGIQKRIPRHPVGQALGLLDKIDLPSSITVGQDISPLR